MALETLGICIHSLILSLGVKHQALDGLHEVVNLLFMVVESDADPLDLRNQLVELLIILDCFPSRGCFQLGLDLLRALVV